MTHKDYFYPLPKDHLTDRFSKIFTLLKKNQSGTLVALPHTGRTNNLRFLCNDRSLLQELDLLPASQCLIFLDSEKVDDTYESFLSEVLYSLLNTTHCESTEIIQSALVSRDSFLLSKVILDLIQQITRTSELYFIITLNYKFLPFIQEIDRTFVQIIKSASVHPITLLWSCDSILLHSYSPGHASSSLFMNVCYYPTFTEKETAYSIARLLSLRGELLPKKILPEQLNRETGGIAGLFKSYLSIMDFRSGFNTEDFVSIPYVSRVIKTLQQERSLLKQSLSVQLFSDSAEKFLTQVQPRSIVLGEIQLKGTPTSQDVRLLRLLQQHMDLAVSRENVAQALWGDETSEKYSPWALDQAISRLRKKLDSSHYKLLTIKNFGYQLLKLS